ncbi:MAG TPA: hydroxyacid dehydrogenase [Ktedonobacteraceae bacterium]|nr:hydroxyacid dehydrogenase [Ktedonobacteraceae bacterium]
MALARVWTGRVLCPAALAVLEGLAAVTVTTVGERNDWYGEAAEAVAIMVMGETFVTGEVMDKLPRLRVIARTGIGVDRIDLDAATRRGIMVVNSPDGPTESTAEHAVALLLNLCKGVMTGDRILRAGRPFPMLTELTPGFEVAGNTLGLVGLGRIGSRVAAIAQVLGMKVIAFDPFITAKRASALGVELIPSLAELLPRAQVVSLHCPATPETRHIMNAGTLSLMPVGSYLINVARGALVDEDALLAALRSGHLAGAALDVFDPEPPMTNHPLFTHPHTICTPHMGSYTRASVERMQVMTCEQIAFALRGERPTNLVNPAVWGRSKTQYL